METSAEDLETVDEVTCPVCIGKLISPRYLPTCRHTFCENCLFTFVLNLKKSDELGTAFECPVCRQPNPSPENGEVTLKWIQTFPKNLTLVSSKTETRETENVMCDLCCEQGESNIGITFCMECQEVLCGTCEKYHNKFKLFKGHKLIPHDDALDKTAFRGLAKYKKCPKHPEKDIELFCNNDNSLCCTTCAAAHHRSCINIVTITDMGQEKEDVVDLETNLKYAIKHLNQLETLETEHLCDMKAKLKEIPMKLTDFRDKWVKLMDDMVVHTTTDAKQKTKELEVKHEESVYRLKELKEICEKKMDLLKTATTYGSDTDVFLAIQNINGEFVEVETKVMEVNSNIKRIDFKFDINEGFNEVTKMSSDKIANIRLEECVGKHSKYEPHGILKQNKFDLIAEHNIRLIDECSPTFSGVSACNGRIVLCDSCSHVSPCGYMCVFTQESTDTLKKLRMNKPFCAAFIDENLVAVSVPDDKTICVASVNNDMNIVKKLKTQFKSRTIVVLNSGYLAVSWEDPSAFGIIDISGSELVQKSYIDQDKAGRKFKSFDYLAVDEKRSHVFQPCSQDKAVYCFDFSGEPVFIYSEKTLQKPRGVTLDRYGNAYVCDSGVHKLSPRGQHICIIELHVKYDPLAICFDKITSKFWITKKSGKYETICCYELANK